MGDRVTCEVSEEDLASEDGNRMIPGVVLKCSRCGHTTESYGTSERSIKRCLALMREECPEGESNFYVADK